LDIDKTQCPKWEDTNETIDTILKWADAEVTWSDTFINGNNEVSQEPEWACWSLCWEYGVIGFDGLRDNTPENHTKAFAAAALFIYLWCKGIPANIADNCAAAYVSYYKLPTRENKENNDAK